jgi:hypothetical protein
MTQETSNLHRILPVSWSIPSGISCLIIRIWRYPIMGWVISLGPILSGFTGPSDRCSLAMSRCEEAALARTWHAEELISGFVERVKWVVAYTIS